MRKTSNGEKTRLIAHAGENAIVKGGEGWRERHKKLNELAGKPKGRETLSLRRWDAVRNAKGKSPKCDVSLFPWGARDGDKPEGGEDGSSWRQSCLTVILEKKIVTL